MAFADTVTVTHVDDCYDHNQHTHHTPIYDTHHHHHQTTYGGGYQPQPVYVATNEPVYVSTTTTYGQPYQQEPSPYQQGIPYEQQSNPYQQQGTPYQQSPYQQTPQGTNGQPYVPDRY